MLHMVLFLLKIIGILLGVIVGLLLILILIVLLVPIRYSVWADNREDLQGRVKITWLLRIISFQIAYANEKLCIILKIFGRIIFDNNNPRVKKKKRNKTKKSKTKRSKNKKSKIKIDDLKTIDQSTTSQSSTRQSTSSQNLIGQSKISNANEETLPSNLEHTKMDTKYEPITEPNKIHTSVVNISEKVIKPELSSVREFTGSKDDSINEPDDKINIIRKIKDFFKKIKKFFQKIKDFFQKIKLGLQKVKDKLQSISDVISSLLNKWDKIKAFYHVESNKQGIKHIFHAIKKMLKHLLPRKIRGQVEFGTGDPSSTGQALGVVACFYGIYGESIQVIPNFEEIIFEGNILIMGRIRIGTLLIIVVKLILNKDFKGLIKNFRAFKEDL